MVEVVDWETDRVDGVTLVRGTVTNTRTTAQLARIESTLDGPTWQPRGDHGTVPEWDDGAWEAVVEPSAYRGFGFATPAEPQSGDRRPFEIVATRRIEDRSADALADLDAWAPPRDVLPEGR
jgi:hypothetical protein